MATPEASTDSQPARQRLELRNRYRFTGTLAMETALHIGGGKATLSSSDSPVVLTPDQQPYIPGSSFKGALRSTVEKMAANLPGFSTCALMELDEAERKEEAPRGIPMEQHCPTIRLPNIFHRRRDNPNNTAAIDREIWETLCDTCWLFGSPFSAARVNVSDLYTSDDGWSGVLQIRDGVAIDRDSEKAKDRLKYDFEVVPATATFAMQIVLENATRKDVQLLCVGLSEFARGFGAIGGKRSRGLGVARLNDLRVEVLELFEERLLLDEEGTPFPEGIREQQVGGGERRKRLKQYLISNEFPQSYDGAVFLEGYLTSIFDA